MLVLFQPLKELRLAIARHFAIVRKALEDEVEIPSILVRVWAATTTYAETSGFSIVDQVIHDCIYGGSFHKGIKLNT